MHRIPTIRIGKQFRFETAHALKDYDGPCANVHGHSYVLTVVLSGKPKSGHAEVPDGMVMDFVKLKSIVDHHIIQHLDHKLLLHEDDERRHTLNKTDELVLLPRNPTCEMMVVFIQQKLLENLPAYVRLELVHLQETATSFAEWRRQENA